MDENKNLPAERPVTDLTEKDEDALQKFVEANKPGLLSVDKDEVKNMLELYMSGKTYRHISGLTRKPKVLIMYLSKSMDWFNMRQEFLSELEEKNLPRIVEAKLREQDFLLDLHQMWQKKIRARINSYNLSNDESQTNRINLKEIELFLKVSERLQKSIEQPKASAPLVGINMPDGATLTRTGTNTIEVTPKEKAMDGMLAKFADLQRAEKAKK